jgi:Uma2 family endonuclease
MNPERRVIPPPEIVYPDCDDQPMAEHSLQELWITRIAAGVRSLIHERDDAFAAVDNFWYPVKGFPEIAVAPDVYVVFGRPKRILVDGLLVLRGSYQQWLEDDIPPQVVFEIRSPSNSDPKLEKKLIFYEEHGAEEYYLIDPFRNRFHAWRRSGRQLQPIDTGRPVTSPRLGIHFIAGPDELRILHPDGRPFRDPPEIQQSEDEARRLAEAEHRRAEAEHRRAEAEHRRAEASDQRALEAVRASEAEHSRAEDERVRAEEALARAAALEERLRSLGIEP